MTPEKLLLTSGLLGLFTLAGGGYGVLYCLGKIQKSSAIGVAALACYLAQCITALAIVIAMPLLLLWKLLIIASCIAYFFIPPITLRYLIRLHESSGSRSC